MNYNVSRQQTRDKGAYPTTYKPACFPHPQHTQDSSLLLNFLNFTKKNISHVYLVISRQPSGSSISNPGWPRGFYCLLLLLLFCAALLWRLLVLADHTFGSLAERGKQRPQ
jgi:hypothetical protein